MHKWFTICKSFPLLQSNQEKQKEKIKGELIVTIKKWLMIAKWLICPHVYENAHLIWKGRSHLDGKITPFFMTIFNQKPHLFSFQIFPVNSRFVNTMWNILVCAMQNSNQSFVFSLIYLSSKYEDLPLRKANWYICNNGFMLLNIWNTCFQQQTRRRGKAYGMYIGLYVKHFFSLICTNYYNCIIIDFFLFV